MRGGFSLIEVVVALLLLEVGVVAAAGTLLVAARSLTEAEHLERAVLEAEGTLDSLSRLVTPEGGSRAYAGGALEWSVDSSGAVLLTVLSSEGETRLEVTSAVLTR